MTNNIILDTCFLCALCNQADVNHVTATEQWRNFFVDESKIFIPEIVLYELSILARPKHKKIHNAIQTLLQRFSFQVIKPSLPIVQNTINQTDFPLKINDYLILISAKKVAGKVSTFDKKLQQYTNL